MRLTHWLPRIAVATVGFGAAALTGLGGAGSAQADPAVTLSPTGHVVVTARGNGHGHGLSQYGAYGAALAGLSTRSILAHYYPGTTYTRISGRTPTIRVKLSDAGSTTTIMPASGLHLCSSSDRTTLPTAGVRRYRLVADAGDGVTLQRMLTKAGDTRYFTVRSGLPDNECFWRDRFAPIRLMRTDGSSTSYADTLHAVRATSGVRTVNYVDANSYAAGVTPREMPSSWSAAATGAQAVAARTYAMYERAHADGDAWDICDTSSCQVYGGAAHYSADGSLQWTDYLPAAKATWNGVLTYHGQPAFTQYSASNGGAMSDGGQPYLRAGTDAYDPGRSGDPYINTTDTVSTSSLAHYFGLATVNRIQITGRDGHGAWGGRVTQARLTGTDSSRHAATRSVDGDDLQWALGLGTTLFTVSGGH